MQADVLAAIELYGTTLRYAELERYGRQRHLLRLGSCSFGFDASDEVLGGGTPGRLGTVREALRDAFAGSAASHVTTVLHPPAAASTFVPVPADLDDTLREARLHEEAALLAAPLGEPRPRRALTADVLYNESVEDGSVTWTHALTLPQAAPARLGRLLDGVFERAAHRPQSSLHATATALWRLAERDAAAGQRDGLALGLGRYGTHNEIVVTEGARWRYGCYAPSGPPANVAYFAAQVLHHLGHEPGDVRHAYVYGGEVDPRRYDLLADVTGCDVRPLDPLRVIDLDPGHLAADFPAHAYAPCLGALL